MSVSVKVYYPDGTAIHFRSWWKWMRWLHRGADPRGTRPEDLLRDGESSRVVLEFDSDGSHGERR